MTVQEVVKKHIEKNTLAIIAIDGRSASGKTTFAKEIASIYDATLFHMDDYFLPPQRKTKERLSEPGGNVDYERFEKEVLQQLQRTTLTTQKFNCQTNTLEEKNEIELSSIIIVEGAYSLHPNLANYYGLKLFFDIDPITQKERILARNGEKMLARFVNEWIPLEEAYIKQTNLTNRVDFIHKT